MSLNIVFEGVCVTKGDKNVLTEVYGAVQPGQIMAVMGPSGGGKTTLMNCLSGRAPVTSGTITLNGQTLNKQLSRKICYVLQQDAFFPNLTLLETLMFTAMIRLPDGMPVQEKVDKLQALIDALDLRRCVNTVMGGMWKPGLSGGETKRASIACELITDPTIILLDEPTSGLDYKTAFSLIRTLKNYASDHGKTVISTLHQPSSQMFHMFDLLLLMCEGHSVYYGSPGDVTQFFAAAGFPMAQHYNPADFILEKIKESKETQEKIIKASYETRKVGLTSRSYEDDLNIDNDLDIEGKTKVRMWNKLPWKQIRKKKINKKNDTDVVHVSLMDLDKDELSPVPDQNWPTGFLTQYKYLTVRAFRQAKTRLVDKFKIFETVFLCVLLSLIWFQLPRSEDTLRDRMGLIFYISMHWGFTPLFDAVTTFPMEKVVIYKERASGWYRLSAYYLAKMTSELPVILIQPLLFLTVVYWVTGLNNVSSFFATIGTIFVHSIAGQSIGLCIGIFAMDMRRGISWATVAIMFIMLSGGFYTRNLPFWLDWAKYLAFLHYTFSCLMFLEFHDGEDVICAKITSSSRSNFPSCLSDLPRNITLSPSNNTASLPTIPSQEVLLYYGIDQPFWHYFLPLFAFLIVFRILGYVLLRFYQKPH
ncbi:uncharacterized protein LOC123537135 [Mercenaria mercenaria]|uniref:uncharacterized protein LOC123537135 n=1 Tax=Mercenaria mercenaria TaxID=6596 RepID=UPI00234F9111|nr:uncharacterized protein LOC123537135 [Mercenaria mercenaria]